MKRLIATQHLLLDCTFPYPLGFYQTLIIIYYDPLEYKMIPGILAIINNKATVRYEEIFGYIKKIYIFH